MHPLRHTRNAIFIGLLFSSLGVIYLVVQTIGEAPQIDYAGATMLLLLGIAMGVMAYVLIAGTPND